MYHLCMVWGTLDNGGRQQWRGLWDPQSCSTAYCPRWTARQMEGSPGKGGGEEGGGHSEPTVTAG